MTRNSDDSSTCPRCGGPLPHVPALGGVCLRCAGLRVLNLESTGVGGGIPISDTSAQIGPYAVIEELGRGGMGRVVAAAQPELGRIVAVKTIRAGVDPELDLRFLREVQTLSSLRHPNIVAIHDSGRTPDSLYFSMDYIEGGDLATRLHGGALHPREAVPLMRKVANALAYLHAQGVLHRDLKPSNILLDGAEPKLADFGLAAQLEAGGDLTALTRVLGTPHYLAPEALLKGSAAYSVAGDIYSFGVVLYELLTGRTPFAGASPEGLLGLVRDSEPPAPRLLVPALPRDLEVICLKCLDRDPTRRYTTAAALEDDLVRFQTGQPILARPLSRAERLWRWARHQPQLAAIWLLVCGIAVVSTLSAVRITREQTRTAAALADANAANALARERLRTARLAEARAVVSTTAPGRRAQALAAVAEAAAIRPGVDLRDAALAALTTVDVEPVDTWDLQVGVTAENVFSTNGSVAAIRTCTSGPGGTDKREITLRERGRAEPLGVIETPSPILGMLSLSADGGLLAVRLEDATLRVWSTRSVTPVWTLEHLSIPGAWPRMDQNTDYALNPSGDLLAVGHPTGGVDLYSLPEGKLVATWPSTLLVQSLRYSPDGRWLAASRIGDPTDRQVTLLDGVTAQPLGTMTVPADLNCFVWAADSQLLGLVTSDNGCTWFTVPDCRRIDRVNTSLDGAMSVAALGPDDLLLYPADLSLRLLAGTSGKEELTFPDIGPSLVSAINNGREFLTASTNNVVTRWRQTPRPGWRMIPAAHPESTGYGLGPWAMDVSADGRWIVQADGNHLVVYDVRTGRTAALAAPDPSTYVLATAAFAADGSRLWRVSTYSGVTTHPFTVAADGRSVAIGAAETLDPARGFTIAAISADRRTLALTNSDSGRVKVLRVSAAGTVVESTVEWSAPGAYSAAFSPDASRLLVNCSGTGETVPVQRLFVYRTIDGSVERELPAQARGEAVWSADGTTAMTSNGPETTTVWNTNNWTPRCVLGGNLGGDVSTFTLSADGRTALVLRDARAHLLSTTDGTVLASLKLTGAECFCVSLRQFRPGQFTAMQVDGRIDLLDVDVWNAELTKLGLGW